MRVANRYMRSRQVQNESLAWVRPSASPAMARWNACECRLGMPGTTACAMRSSPGAGGVLARIEAMRPASSIVMRTSRAQPPGSRVSAAWRAFERIYSMIAQRLFGPPMNDRYRGTRHAQRVVRAPRGATLSCRSWLTEAPFRMIQNNLDPEVAEHPEDLVVYGGIGRAARDWECFDRIVDALRRLESDQTLLIQSGKPVGIFRTHADAPRVLIANSNLVPHWATREHFHE